MTEERRYDEAEVAEILDRATALEPSPSPASSPAEGGLTLPQLKEIGAEVGIPPDRIAEAAKALDRRPLVSPPRRFLGAPRSVSRIVPLPRPMEDEEWNRLVADLRQTFEAVGNVQVHGHLRSWSNGNLQVHVEPGDDGYRVRMRTLKEDAVPRAIAATAFVFMGILALLASLLGEGDWSGIFVGAVFSLGGLGQLGYTRTRLSRWSLERANQMEGLAQRIPLLLSD